MVWLSSLPEDGRVGIHFRDFELFCRLLNNLEDFTVAIKYSSEVGRPLSRKEFKRAAKVCLNGNELSSHLVDTIFVIFGAGEGKSLKYDYYCTELYIFLSDMCSAFYILTFNISISQVIMSFHWRSLQMS